MGQFKSMVKMKTDEPSVILKLKKGGHVASAHKDEHGHTNMKGDAFKAKHSMDKAEDGAAPKKPSMADRRKAMSGALLNSKKGGKVAKHEDAAQDRAMIKKAMAGKKFAAGGTIEGNTGKFVKTKVVDGDKKDTAKGTGAVKMGKPAGFKTGGTIEGNAGKFAKTKVVDGDKKDTAKGTKGIKEGQPAGYKKGGTIGWENRPANDGDKFDSAHGTKGVRDGNAGGYKKGGAAKKHFATGGSVNDAGRAVAMPRKPVSQPVSNSRQSGTFKKGGKVRKFADGGTTGMPAAPQGTSAPPVPAVNTSTPPVSPAELAQIALIQKQNMGGMGTGQGRPPMGGFGGMQRPQMGFGVMGRPGMPAMGGQVAQPMPIGRPQPMPIAPSQPMPNYGPDPRPYSGPGAPPKPPLPTTSTERTGPAAYKRGGKVERFDGGSKKNKALQFAPGQDMSDVNPQDVADAKLRAQQSDAVDKLLGTAPTQKQLIHTGGYKKGGNAKR